VKQLAARCALIAVILPTLAGAADGQPEVVASLRDTGYMLGDLLDERVEVSLPDGMHIDPDSLPLAGRVAPWLEVRSTVLEPVHGRTQTAVVTYQIFAEAEEATRVPLPAFQLRVKGAGAGDVTVPSRSFLLSPALPPTLVDQDREIRPSPEPEHVLETGALGGVLASFAVALATAGYLLWRYDFLPFLPHAPGPLLRAWRSWRRRSKRELTSEEETALLRDLHGALSQSAGETLYPSTLPRLFDRAPYLAPLREEIERVFVASWQRFYGRGNAPAPANALATLRDAADRERGVPC
jgi:mxaA protein